MGQCVSTAPYPSAVSTKVHPSPHATPAIPPVRSSPPTLQAAAADVAAALTAVDAIHEPSLSPQMPPPPPPGEIGLMA
jgi:hypothetical protein